MKNYSYILAALCSLLFLSSFSQPLQNEETHKTLLLSELQLNNSKTLKLSDLKGKVILLDFWYRGCLPCLKATPDLIKIQEEFKHHLVIIGINDRDNKDDITDYYSYKKANYFSTYKTENNIAKNLKINSFPTFIIINQTGEIVKTISGFSKREIRQNIKNLIKK